MRKKIISTQDEPFEIKAQEYERGLRDAQPEVDMGFVNIWSSKYFYEYYKAGKPVSFVLDLLKEAGVEIKK